MSKAGEVIGGRYVLEAPLGKGGFGEVWRAKDRAQPDRSIALKILHAELARNPRMAERFAREAMVLSALDHPCIARSFDFGTKAMPPFIAMELVSGRTLQSEIEEHAIRRTLFTEREVLVRMELIASAIDHAHGIGVIHRDLKPGNVIVDTSRSPLSLKVLDFGVAKILGENSDATTAGRIIGSLHYLSPEHIRGEELDPRADVFSLGTLLFELLTLRRVWTRDWEDRPLLAGRGSKETDGLNTTPAVMQRILNGMRVRAGLYREGLNVAVDEVLARALASERSARFESAGELVFALEAAFSGVPPAPLAASLINAAVPTGTLNSSLPSSLAAAAAPTAGLPSMADVSSSGEQETPRIAAPMIEATVATVLSPRDATAAIIDPREQTAPAFSSPIASHAASGAYVSPGGYQVRDPAASLIPAHQSGAEAIGLPPWLTRALVVLAIVAPIFAIAVLMSTMSEDRALEPRVETPPPLERVAPEAVPQPVARATAQEVEKAQETPVKIDEPARPKPNKTTAPLQKIENPPEKAPAYPELRALLNALDEKPNDPAIAEELSKKIAAAADRLQDADRRTSIKRCAAGALFPLDAKELERCYRELVAAAR